MIHGETMERLQAWWNHEDMERPCFITSARKWERPIPDTDDMRRYWMDERFVVERETALIDDTRFLCEAVPHHCVSMGPAALAACLGGELQFTDRENAWNHPFLRDVGQINELVLKPDNPYWAAIKKITALSAAASGGHHYVTLPALAGVTDLLSSIYGLDALLLDMIDRPDEVKRASAHLMDVWLQAFHELSASIASSGNGGSVGCWTGVWSPGTSYAIQEDISCMLSPDMFREFCLPAIDTFSQALEYPFYHLDGRGAAKFADMLLGVGRLKVIQWIPGEGGGALNKWYELIRHILDGGKSVHVYAGEDEIVPLVKAVGCRGLLVSVWFSGAERYELFREEWRLD